MEEILLSIRRIIADDQALFASRDGVPAEPPRSVEDPDRETSDLAGAAKGAKLEQAGAPGKGTSPSSDLAEASIRGDDRPSSDDPLRVLHYVGKEAAAKVAAETAAFAAFAKPDAAIDLGAPPRLLSPAADASVASAFNALIASRFARNSDAVAALTHEMLRPMLKAWLDDNLPALVERLVRAEIERVARGD